MSEKQRQTAYWDMGQRIKQAREQCTKLNQSEMTVALGLREPTYGNYERGDRRMPHDVIDKFIELTGCRSDWIISGKGPMRQLTEKESNLINVVQEMGGDFIDALLSYAGWLKAEKEKKDRSENP